MDVDDVIQVQDQYYILASSSLADDRTRVLKQGDTFAVFDKRGDIEPVGKTVHGLYNGDTRFLSQWILRLGKDRPLLLSSAVRNDNALLAVDLTNPDFHSEGRVMVPRGTLHFARSIFIWNDILYERLKIVNYSLTRVDMPVVFRFSADFLDIFEVRGMDRDLKGAFLPEKTEGSEVRLAYKGLDGITRETSIHCSAQPEHVS